MVLKASRTRPRLKKADWYSAKVRVHFDLPLTRSDAEIFVSNPANVARHSFLPLIAFDKVERRYRRKGNERTPSVKTKKREIAYPGHRDGYIYAYYSEQLEQLYEHVLNARGLSGCVIGYRKGASNIRLAKAAFSEVVARGECLALAFDIQGFFDNIDHDTLKRAWSGLLGLTFLPSDHWAVFRALTAGERVERDRLLESLGLSPGTRDRDLLRPVCTVRVLREMRCANSATQKLVKRNKIGRGIPQGTPISGMAANVAMLEFDTAVQQAVDRLGGSYRRYSDDILILCAPEHAEALERTLITALTQHAVTLQLNDDKTERVTFRMPGPHIEITPPRRTPKPLQYLGFTFDGKKIRIRDGTLARYYRRLSTSVDVAKAMAKKARLGKVKGRDVIHKRDILAKHSHLGVDNFIRGYAANSAREMGDLGDIRRQTRKHMGVIRRRLED